MSSETDPQPIQIEYTSEFKRNLRQLVKKYKRIRVNIQPILDALGQGQILGDQIPGVQYEIYKVRAQNTNSGKGKSGGYRIIYQRTSQGVIILITIYSKTEQSDVTHQEIRQILQDYANQLQATLESDEEATPQSTPTE